MPRWLQVCLSLAVVTGWLGDSIGLASVTTLDADASATAKLDINPTAATNIAAAATSQEPPAPPAANASTSSAVNNGVTISGPAQENRFVSVPRFFRRGDIPNFAQAVVNGTALLTQCDVKNRWPDGSLKFAIISFVVPKVTSHGPEVRFQNQPTGNNEGYLGKSEMLDGAYDFEGTIQLAGKANHSISARSMLEKGHFRYWLRGPIVSAVIN